MPILADTPKAVLGKEFSIACFLDIQIVSKILNFKKKSLNSADYAYWRALMSLASEGPAELVDIAFKFTGTFQGTTSPPPR